MLYAVADNRIAQSLNDAAVANTAYPWDELIVGCNWLFNSFQGTQGGTCFGAAVKFDVTPLGLHGGGAGERPHDARTARLEHDRDRPQLGERRLDGQRRAAHRRERRVPLREPGAGELVLSSDYFFAADRRPFLVVDFR